VYTVDRHTYLFRGGRKVRGGMHICGCRLQAAANRNGECQNFNVKIGGLL